MDGRLTRALALVALLALAAVSAGTAKPPPTVGQKCAKAGATIGAGPSRTLVCTKVGTKLVWKLQKAGSGKPSAGGGSSGGSTCTAPVAFTANLIDPSYVEHVNPIGGQTGSGGVVAVRSYIFPYQSLAGQHLPLYAPTALTLVGGTYYQLPGSPYKPEYSLELDAGCGITINLYHVKEVSAKLAAVLPQTPTPSSATAGVTPTKIAAGEQIGAYVPGGTDGVSFDFWVDDASVTNSFITPARFGHSNYLHAVCPYQFYSGAMRATWYAKIGGSSGPVAGASCGTVSQGVSGTAEGMWFLDPNPATGQADVLTYDGTYMSQAIISEDPDGSVRVGGFYSSTYIITGKSDPSWADPATVTSSHCWYDSFGNRSLTVQLQSATTMRAAVVSGPCPASIDAGAWKTYYR